MAKASSILKRAKSVGNIRTLTNTMEMIARAEFGKAYSLVTGARPYTGHLTDLVADVVARSEPGQLKHPLIGEGEELKRDALLVPVSYTHLRAHET